MSTIMRAYDTFLGDDKLSGQALEASLDELYFRAQLEYANESQRYLSEGLTKIWSEVTKTSLAKVKGGKVYGGEANGVMTKAA